MALTVQKNPVRQTVKAGKRVGKALSIFEKAASELERASAEHLAAAEALDEQSAAVVEQADRSYESAMKAARANYGHAIDNADDLALLADVNEGSAHVAQVQADNLRSLISVV